MRRLHRARIARTDLSTPRGRRSKGSLLSSVVVLGALVAGPSAVVLATPSTSLAASTTESSYTVATPLASVKIANGQTWNLQVSYSYTKYGSTSLGGLLAVTLERGSLSSEESHTWAVPIETGSPLTFSTSTKKGTLDTGSLASPLAKVDLSISGSTSKKAVCASGSETTYTVTSKGSVELVTGLAKAGTINKTVTFGKGGYVVDNSCVRKISNPCGAGTSWGADDSLSGLAYGANLFSHNYVFVSKLTELSKSAVGASRIDGADMVSSAPSYNSKTHTLSVSATGSSLITGSGTISGGKYKSGSEACTSGGKASHEPEVQTTKGKFSSPAGKAFTAHTVLTGKIVAPTSTSVGSFEITT